MKKGIKNNKGFTLVELLVAFGILAVVMVMVGAVIGISSGTYRNISDDLNLQYDSQLAMSQIQEYVIDCSEAVASADDGVNDVLYLFNVNPNGEKTVYDGYKLALSAKDNTLMLYTKPGFTTEFNKEDASTYLFKDAGQPMSNNVEMFTAELSPDGRSIKITLYYELGRESYTGIQTIAFRNPVTDISAFAPVKTLGEISDSLTSKVSGDLIIK